jgi:hypothetical protein
MRSPRLRAIEQRLGPNASSRGTPAVAVLDAAQVTVRVGAIGADRWFLTPITRFVEVVRGKNTGGSANPPSFARGPNPPRRVLAAGQRRGRVALSYPPFVRAVRWTPKSSQAPFPCGLGA